MATVDTDLEMRALSGKNAAYSRYYDSKGWFSCDEYCTEMKSRSDLASSRHAAVKAESARRISGAKAQAGIFSTMGVDEVRDSFWSYFRRGPSSPRGRPCMTPSSRG